MGIKVKRCNNSAYYKINEGAIIEADNLDETDRNEKGFSSTGN